MFDLFLYCILLLYVYLIIFIYFMFSLADWHSNVMLRGISVTVYTARCSGALLVYLD